MIANDNSGGRVEFATRLGVIATTVGSAVGLGNIWRFPYEAGVHGGGAFMLLYVFFIVVLGIPVLSAEFFLGRASRRGAGGAFGRLGGGKGWRWMGIMGVVASVLILSFYSVVAGWTLEYTVRSAAGMLGGRGDAELHAMFGSFTAGWRPVVWTLIFLGINYFVITRGVRGGIERVSNVMTPLLFVMLVAFCINSLTLDGARRGLEFLFKPDFSKLTAGVVIGAMGQAFFSLSLGIGVMLTYASYFKSGTDIVKSAATTAMLDTVVAILAGVMIFPAVFSYGMSPDEGPTLVFEVLPSIFNRMPLGTVWSTLFFMMLFVASLTSTISMCENSVAYLSEERGMSRRGASRLTIATAVVLGTLSALSFSYLAGWRIGTIEFNMFGWLDYLTSNVMLPLGGMGISIFAGYYVDRGTLDRYLDPDGRRRWATRLLTGVLRYVAPALIAIIFVVNL